MGSERVHAMRRSCLGKLQVLFAGFVLGGIIGWMSLPLWAPDHLPTDASLLEPDTTPRLSCSGRLSAEW